MSFVSIRDEQVATLAVAMEASLHTLAANAYSQGVRDEQQRCADRMAAVREVMAEMADDIENTAMNQYPHREQYPSELRRFNATMEIVHRARALIEPTS